MRINTNVASLKAQKHLALQDKRNTEAMTALSSGSRINSASDDAAGLAISEGLRAQNRGNRVAKRNAQDAISFIQVGEGGLNEINNIMIRLRELGVQSASDTIGDTEREFIDQEGQQLLGEVDRIVSATKYNNKSLINGSVGTLEFQVGVDGNSHSRISFNSKVNASTSSLGISGLSFDDKYEARNGLEDIDEALEKLGGMRSSFGAMQNRLDSTINNLDSQNESLTAAYSRIKDADIAEESSKFVSSQILKEASVGLLAQANQSKMSALSLLK